LLQLLVRLVVQLLMPAVPQITLGSPPIHGLLYPAGREHHAHPWPFISLQGRSSSARTLQAIRGVNAISKWLLDAGTPRPGDY